MSNFMNMNYDDNINLGNIFGNMTGMPDGVFPFGNIHVRVHTFPTDIFLKMKKFLIIQVFKKVMKKNLMKCPIYLIF